MTLGFSRRRAGFELPNSAIHRWKFDEGGGSTVTDSIGSADGTIYGASWASGTWIGDNALDGDGTDDYVNVGSPNDMAAAVSGQMSIAFTVQLPTQSSVTNVFGCVEDNPWLLGYAMDDGSLRWALKDDSNVDITVQSDTAYDDNLPHRVVFNKTGDSNTDLSIHVDGSSVPVSYPDTGTIGSFSAPFGSAEGVSTDFYLFARSNNDSPERYTDCLMDDIIYFDDALTSQQITDDYDRQPWS